EEFADLRRGEFLELELFDDLAADGRARRGPAAGREGDSRPRHPAEHAVHLQERHDANIVLGERTPAAAKLAHGRLPREVRVRRADRQRVGELPQACAQRLGGLARVGGRGAHALGPPIGSGVTWFWRASTMSIRKSKSAWLRRSSTPRSSASPKPLRRVSQTVSRGTSWRSRTRCTTSG